jgi:hypothetical protein
MTERRADQRSTGSGGALPTIPPELPDVDERPGRRDLLRQIAALERHLSEVAVTHSIWNTPRAGRERGPAMLSMEELEQVRDELFAALAELRQRIVMRERGSLGDDIDQGEA